MIRLFPSASLYHPPLNPTLAPQFMAGPDPGLDPAIGCPHQFANDAIPVSNHPMEMAGSSQVKPSHDVLNAAHVQMQTVRSTQCDCAALQLRIGALSDHPAVTCHDTFAGL